MDFIWHNKSPRRLDPWKVWYARLWRGFGMKCIFRIGQIPAETVRTKSSRVPGASAICFFPSLEKKNSFFHLNHFIRHEPVHAVKNENKSIMNNFLVNFDPYFHAGWTGSRAGHSHRRHRPRSGAPIGFFYLFFFKKVINFFSKRKNLSIWLLSIFSRTSDFYPF